MFQPWGAKFKPQGRRSSTPRNTVVGRESPFERSFARICAAAQHRRSSPKKRRGRPWKDALSERLTSAVDQLLGAEAWEEFGCGWWMVTFPGFSQPPWGAEGRWHCDGAHFRHYPHRYADRRRERGVRPPCVEGEGGTYRSVCVKEEGPGREHALDCCLASCCLLRWDFGHLEPLFRGWGASAERLRSAFRLSLSF